MRHVLVVVVMGVLLSGCATGPKTALMSSSLKADHVVYFEQSDRVPKDVLLAAHGKKDNIVNAMEGIPAEIIAKIIEQLLSIIPELSENYTEERMYNALIGRRMLFRGYDTPEQLEKINEIIKSMGDSIEYLTPQGEQAQKPKQ